MHRLASFNFTDVDIADAAIPALSAAAISGRGIFTTIAIHEGQPFLWEKHWRRLATHAAAIGIDTERFDESDVKQSLLDLIRTNGDVGRARITFIDEAPTEIWDYDAPHRTSILITTAERRVVPTSFRLTLSPFTINSQSPLAAIKSSNYLEKVIAKREANDRAFDECVQVNERGEIVSASMANIFWLKDGELRTPSLETGCLAGTTREFVIENLECAEVTVGIDELRRADAIFLTSAGLGVVRVAELDGHRLGNHDHPITTILPNVR